MSIKNESNLLNQKIIFDITKFTTTDFADHLSCIVWFAKCNMRCLYCYNDNIVYAKEGNYTIEELLDFLMGRKGLLDSVVLSGGEATLNNLVFVSEKIKALGYEIKLDTNGLNPNMIKELNEKKLIDFISLDYKAPKYKFEEITHSSKYELFEESLLYLIQSDLNFEVRTTVHNDLLNSFDINHMIEHLHLVGYSHNYYLQEFLETPSNIGNIKQSENCLDRDKIISDKLNIVYRD